MDFESDVPTLQRLVKENYELSQERYEALKLARSHKRTALDILTLLVDADEGGEATPDFYRAKEQALTFLREHGRLIKS